MIARPSLLLLTAVSAAVATIGNAVGLAAAPREPQPRSRLGVAIADDLGQRNRAATQRGRTLDLREQAVRAAEQRLKGDVEQRQQPAAAATADASQPGAPGAPGGVAAASDQYDDLARIYQAMKPAAAAMVLERLDIDVQMRVAQKMRERSTAMLLAAMTPKGAAALTMALARRTAGRPVAVAKLR